MMSDNKGRVLRKKTTECTVVHKTRLTRTMIFLVFLLQSLKICSKRSGPLKQGSKSLVMYRLLKNPLL